MLLKTQNVFASSEISIQLEGTAIPFTFNALSNKVTIPVVLIAGSHDLNIKVSNTHGTAIDEVELIYKVEEPCNAPVISMDAQFNTSLTVDVVSGQITGSISDAEAIIVKKDGSNYSDFTYNKTTDIIRINYTSLQQGYNNFEIIGHNPCGKDVHEVILDFDPPSIPCDKPILVIAESSGTSVNVTSDNGMFTSYLGNATGVAIQKDGSAYADFNFNATSGNLVINYSNLNDGANVFTIIGTNSCGDTTGTYTLNYDAPNLPCDKPQVTVTTVLSGSTLVVTGQSDYLVFSITNATSVGVTKDGFNHSDYVVKPSTGTLIVKLTTINAGPNEFVVIAQNECGTNEKSITVIYNHSAAPEPCGPRFNPGNSDWEFCLITPSGTFNRSDLNSGFSYAGPASSVYFKPIAGGGEATVGGSSYPVSSGQYYLFSGFLTVDVSSSHPGSMGHWEICIESDNTPTSGNGKNRPISPCESKSGGNSGGNNGNNTKQGNSNGDPKNQNSGSDQEKKAAEAAKKAEEAKKAAEAAKKAEEAKKADEAAKKVEQAKKAAEAAKKAEEAKKAAEAAKKVEQAKKAAEAAKKVEEAKKAAEAAKKAEEAKKADEAAKKVEQAKKAAEAAKKAEEAKKS